MIDKATLEAIRAIIREELLRHDVMRKLWAEAEDEKLALADDIAVIWQRMDESVREGFLKA